MKVFETMLYVSSAIAINSVAQLAEHGGLPKSICVLAK